nr:thiamine pyrophosphate-dependent enzyme [Tomitella fengzijianii]
MTAERTPLSGPLPTSGVMGPAADQADSPALRDRLGDVIDDRGALLRLYRDLAVLRRIDEQCLALARQGTLALWAPIAGQEAVLVGAARASDSHDHLFISYRESLMAYLRGVPPEQVLPMWRGSALGGWDPAEFGITNPAIIVGAHGLHATGYAMAAALDGTEDGAIAFFGDGATSQGDLNEALNFAAVATAPVVFFCTNNQYAISVPVAQQTAVQPAQRAQGFGIPSLRVDGNDVLAVLAATRIATAHVHAGGGPYFVEAVTYRLGPHTTNDDPTRYRSAAEMEAWRARDPVERMRGFLADRGMLAGSDDDAVRAAADEAAQRFRRTSAELPEPDEAGIFAHVYAAPHPLIDEERRAYADYLASIGQAAAAGPVGSSTGQEAPR